MVVWWVDGWCVSSFLYPVGEFVFVLLLDYCRFMQCQQIGSNSFATLKMKPSLLENIHSHSNT